MSLFKNYLRSLYRNALRDKFFTFLNLLGLAIGITATILIILYIQDQLTVDRYNENFDRIYRLEGDFSINGNQDLTAITQLPLGPTLKDEFPEIEEMTRIQTRQDLYFKHGEDSFKEDSIMIADSTIAKVFTLDFVSGDPRTALTEPFTIILSRSMAQKYFGTWDVIGNTMETLDNRQLNITGVFEDLPKNAHMRYNGLISSTTVAEIIGEERYNDRSAVSFWNVTLFTYVLLAENTSPDMVLAKMPEFYDKYMKELGDQINASFDLRMTALKDVHFQKDELTWDLPKGNMSYVYIMAVIGLFLMVIASINYTNLTTARATGRGKEIGIRKVGGANKKTLRSQFLGESLAMALAAGFAATIISILVLPLFNIMAGKSFDYHSILQPVILIFILVISLLTGFLSGIYPASYLASFNPVAILKGNGVSSKDKGWLRTGLVIAQFLISGVMIIGSVVVAQQMNFIQKKDLGFDREHILMLSLNDTAVISNIDAFMEEIERHPSVEETALSTTAPGQNYGLRVLTIENMQGEMVEKAIINCFVNHEYLDAMGLELVEGRFFDRDFGSDQTTGYVVNEALVREMQWGDEAIGRQFIRGVNIQGVDNPEGEIIGVVKDFNYATLHNPIDPLILFCADNAEFMRTLSIRIKGEDHADVLDWVIDKRESFSPAFPVQYSYLNNDLDKLYSEEKTIFTLVLAFSLLIIFIASLGLLGLSSFMTVKRTRETGIRRVMGASQNQILFLFITQFSKWVVISNILAWPLSYFVMRSWLQDFTYRVDFPFWTFIISLLLSLIIAVITVSWQSLRASRTNPAIAIRVE